MSGKIIGIDLGTKVLKLYRKGDGVIFDQQNVIAVENRKKLLAIGDAAAEMMEKAPMKIRVTYPVHNGVIADVSSMHRLFNECFRQLYGAPKKARGLSFLIALPTDITEVEKRAFVDLVLSSEVPSKRVNLVDKPICVALGAGLDVTNSTGIMTVDIGADTTEVSILSLGGIVLSKLINLGGNHIDASIKLSIKKNYNLHIGDKTAEMVQTEIASAVPSETVTGMVRGRDVVTGLPKEVEVSSDMVYEAIQENLHTIVDAVRIILERTPPEISSDIMDAGVYVTGGSANIGHLADLFHRETNLKINIMDDPENMVVKGLGAIMENNQIDTLSYAYQQANFSLMAKEEK